ncbi:MAG TPA: glycoside hydrolase family 38 C-terminal domain-containing protein [Candidatus Sulfotelmatobacter sp.]|nr:glycoside hydrolase family 38 C-terminal domain-containing protein [Candidatus Sulfotelmatobacter sp.]
MKSMRTYLSAALFLSFLLAPLLSFSQQTGNAITISVTEPSSSATDQHIPAGGYLNGYRFTLRGQTINYHSSVPDADSALLVRGQTIAPAISWLTDPLPEHPTEFVQFIWIAGIESAGFEGEKDEHSFDVFINGQPWFVFKNLKDATAKSWKVSGRDGAELSFAAALKDKAGDLFGYMILKVPSKDFETGKPLALEVRGDNSGSADWFMTFQYRFDFTPRLRSEPALFREGARTLQSLRMSLDNLVAGRSVEIQLPDHAPIRAELKIGANAFQLPVPVATSATTVPVVFKINDKVVGTSTASITPVHHREIYLLSYSHNDIGYTELQPVVERKQWNNLEQGMKLIRETRSYPPDARYKWNLETIWALESWLKQATPAQRNEFLADVREGSIGVNALFANMLTGLANATEMSHFFDFARSLRSQYHFPMTTAATSDVPGFSWGIVPALAQSGVKYFATAPNESDRIGYTQAWGDKPFYWSSQSGKELVLTWMAGAGYSSFHQGTLSQLGDEKIMKLLRKLDDNSYPYEMVQLPYTIGDNGGPDPTLPDVVKSWNERYVSPRLILATQEQMFAEFEKRYGSTVPVVKGDFTPYWEDGAYSSASESVLNRAAVDRLIQGEALWTMIAPKKYPADEYASAWRNVTFYDEHTWGAHNSIEEPDLPFVKEQWEFKRKFALDADRESRDLLGKAVENGASPSAPTAVDVYNTNSWPRTDVVYLSPQQSAGGDRVVDEKGNPIPSQRLSSGELAVLVEDVQPFSAMQLRVQKGEPYSKATVSVHDTTLENVFITLSINPQTGAVESLKWKGSGADVVDHSGEGLNQYLYVPGTDPAKAQALSNVRVKVKEQGPLVASLLVEADAPGTKSYSSEVRLAAGIDRVDLITNFDKKAVREKEGVHIAFPFAVPDGQLRYDVADAFVRPEVDQLAGACKNFFSVQSWVDVSNENYGVTWATANAPLIESGSITAEQPWMKLISPSTHFYSYVMNNYWHTNYKADQVGPITFTYSVAPHAAFSSVAAAKFGMERRQPLIVVSASSEARSFKSLLQLSTPDVLVSSLKPMADGDGLLAYLYNPSSSDQKVDFHDAEGKTLMIRGSDASGKVGERIPDLHLAALDSAYVLLQRK